MSNIKTKFRIDGMHCTSCAMTIDMDLEDLDGIKSATTNYAKEITEVEYDTSKLKTQEILEQINKTGYKAEEV